MNVVSRISSHCPTIFLIGDWGGFGGTGSPLPGSAIPRVRHSHGRALGRVRVRVRVKVKVRVRLRVRVRG